MSHVIWKYTLGLGYNTLKMPRNANILSAKIQPVNGEIQLWAKVDPEFEQRDHHFFVAMTGQELPKGLIKYVGTSIAGDGFHVFHVFTVLLNPNLKAGQ